MNRFSGSSPVDIPCGCGSGLPRYPLLAAIGLFCAYVCEACESEVKSRFPPEIFEYKEPTEED